MTLSMPDQLRTTPHSGVAHIGLNVWSVSACGVAGRLSKPLPMIERRGIDAAMRPLAPRTCPTTRAGTPADAGARA